MDCLMDEFNDEEVMKTLNEREVAAWIEVLIVCVLFCFVLWFVIH